MVNNINENAFVYKNQGREVNNSSYLAIKLKGKKGNSNAIGTKLYLYANGSMQYQEVNPNRGYLSCVSTVLNFGLGDNKKIDSLRIIWPDNTTQLLVNVEANQRLIVDQKDTDKPIPIAEPKKEKAIFTKATGIIDHKNEALKENDFKRQLLMLFMYSKTGPVMAKGDINKDGLEDLFVSGDRKNFGRVYVQKAAGKFSRAEDIYIGDENSSSVAAAVFFDANGDGLDDLYVAMGGYAYWEPNTASLQDELYLNDGKGKLKLAKGMLPDVSASSKSCVRPCDYDNDGDMDLFVGGRVVPGKYPTAPKSYLLVNNGKGQFTLASIPFAEAGMVTDAQWSDLNNDGRKDLVLCGEFMPLMIFINSTAGFLDKTNEYFDKPESGFWFSLAVADVDGDGKEDIIAGNLGMNSPLHISEKEPAELFYTDFDGNGSVDPFLNFYVQGKSYPFVSRDELNEQIYPMRKKFSSYKNYADATMNEIFSADELAKATKLSAVENRTLCFLNRNNKFIKMELPLQAQFSMVTKIVTGDYNQDGKTDILLFGNHSDNRLKLGSIDANYGCLLTGDGKGNFKYVDQPSSGICVTGDVKSAEKIVIDGKKYIAIGVADGELIFYKEN